MTRLFLGFVAASVLASEARAAVLPAPATTPAATPVPVLQMLVPGFTVRELPVRLTSLNNIEYAPDGRLFAGGYDGRFHLLRDTDGDGVEDRVDTFSPEPSANYPLGLAVKEGEPYAVLADEVVRWRDDNGDGIPDRRETVVKGFDDPELGAAPYLNHRRVDSSMAIAFDAGGTLYLTMGNAGYNNPYWTDQGGVSHYATDKRRGCLLRLGPEGKFEHLASGLRYVMSLQFNRYGDLFGTDQEGATWVPNGNPFDELLHLQPGRHYGFPPHHPRWLPQVVDEPSVFDYAPQHQSTCGFRFNTPTSGRGLFGPEFWTDDALVTGESRGKLWRTKLARTAAGYLARTELVASVPLLLVDCAISPRGELLVCAHTGKPDWGNGPNGEGRLFQIRYTDTTAPQPVLAWPWSETETVIAFDRPLEPSDWADAGARTRVSAGRQVAAADRWETMRPGYAVVEMQQGDKPSAVAVRSTRVGQDARSVVVETAPRSRAFSYAVEIGPKAAGGAHGLDVAYDLSGLSAVWVGRDGGSWGGWVPHPDFSAAREFTRGSSAHDRLWRQLATPGTLTLRGQLDLWQMLIPATQPGSKLDYVPEPETVTLAFRSDASLQVEVAALPVERVNERELRLTVNGMAEARWLALTLTVATPARTLEVAFTTSRDPRPRAVALRRFLVPFATPVAALGRARSIPEIAGGRWRAGRELFHGKAVCATCHQLRGEGAKVGPDLGNLIHRDYASVLRDLLEPSAAINPDAVGYLVTLKDGEAVTGTRVGETRDELHLAQPGGTVLKLPKSGIERTEPMTLSLMPSGLEKMLTAEELRDLMTYLLVESE
ncbi:MAG: c-type cytochrome [Verrucomicrobiales bacterium]|nr:c-type cytochrome [Verrucomicrobiales bacterium]